ncbi:hypothetical protein, partial [Dielma fastidiosa]|uniref:hypothetical protein n=1 Tax=Dielma fastidiosa TaxID=1034346 RepID=UPI0023EFDEF3
SAIISCPESKTKIMVKTIMIPRCIFFIAIPFDVFIIIKDDSIIRVSSCFFKPLGNKSQLMTRFSLRKRTGEPVHKH